MWRLQLIRNPSSAFTAAILALTLTACGASHPLVRSDYNRNVDFTVFHTFGFPAVAGTDRGGYATLVTGYFKDAIRNEMTARGYVFAATDPELLVNFYSETHDKTEVFATPNVDFGFPYRRPRYGWYSAWPFYEPDVDVVAYKTGSIKIDVVDAKQHQTIWEAKVEEPLTDHAQNNPQDSITGLVAELFRKFPKNPAK